MPAKSESCSDQADPFRNSLLWGTYNYCTVPYMCDVVRYSFWVKVLFLVKVLLNVCLRLQGLSCITINKIVWAWMGGSGGECITHWGIMLVFRGGYHLFVKNELKRDVIHGREMSSHTMLQVSNTAKIIEKGKLGISRIAVSFQYFLPFHSFPVYDV